MSQPAPPPAPSAADGPAPPLGEKKSGAKLKKKDSSSRHKSGSNLEKKEKSGAHLDKKEKKRSKKSLTKDDGDAVNNAATAASSSKQTKKSPSFRRAPKISVIGTRSPTGVLFYVRHCST
jgi:hypothetical protein